jgi:hypothetical protein
MTNEMSDRMNEELLKKLNDDNVKKSGVTKSRAQRRHEERVTKEANKTYEQLCEQFFRALMMEPEPESEHFEHYRKSLNAKWKLYCQKMNFVPETHKAFDNYSKELIVKFKTEKEKS